MALFYDSSLRRTERERSKHSIIAKVNYTVLEPMWLHSEPKLITSVWYMHQGPTPPRGASSG
jgi:hypothetical protein